MNISIDYDGTYTANPDMWDRVIELMQDYNCNVYCVTKRHRMFRDKDIKPNVPIIHAVKSKLEATKATGIEIDIWIDDNPKSITPYKLLNQKRYF